MWIPRCSGTREPATRICHFTRPTARRAARRRTVSTWMLSRLPSANLQARGTGRQVTVPPCCSDLNLPLYTPNGAAGSTKADGFNLDAISLTISKPPGEGDWAAGYSATLLFGPDAVGFNTAPGVGTTTSDFSLVDTYVELRAPVGNGLDFKLGTFASP